MVQFLGSDPTISLISGEFAEVVWTSDPITAGSLQVSGAISELLNCRVCAGTALVPTLHLPPTGVHVPRDCVSREQELKHPRKLLRVTSEPPGVHSWAMQLRERPWRTLMVLPLGAMVLGAVLAVVKGRDYGLGYFVGNLSTPYLLAAFFAGRAVRSRAGAALVGVLMTWITLAAFYVGAEAVFGYPSGSMTRFYLEWFLAGAFSGTALGLLGGESRERVRLRYVLPLALVLEPFAVVVVQAAGRFGGLNLQALQLAVWGGEILLGCVALRITRLRSRRALTE